MNRRTDAREEILNNLREIVREAIGDFPADVYLFGSWARREEKRSSDIDVGILPRGEIPRGVWAMLRERIEESPIPYRVDLVDLSKAEDSFREKVMKEGISWLTLEKESRLRNKP